MFLNSIYDVSYKTTGNELISLLLENEAIKKHYPKYNISNKTFTLNYGLYRYHDQTGFTRIVINKVGKRDKPFVGFSTNSEAMNYVLAKVHEHGLCLRLCGVIDSRIRCSYQNPFGIKCPICEGDIDVEDYNQRVNDAFDGAPLKNTFLIKTEGREKEEQGFVMVENGRFLGYGFVDGSNEVHELDDLKSCLEICYDTQDSQNIIKSFLKRSSLIVESPIKIYHYQDK
jgi:DNA polymerase-3 subunit epsilon